MKKIKQRWFLPFIVHKDKDMRKIISFFAIIIITIVVWQGTHYYSLINQPLINAQNNARIFVEENTDVNNIIEIDFYHGTEAYHILSGINGVGEEVIAWVPYTLDDYLIKRQDEGLSYNEVYEFAMRELNPQKIISIKLGMENFIPLYEIIYKDQQGRYSYYFISFTDGTYLKHYHLKV
jgi:uncharacterized protein YpmB